VATMHELVHGMPLANDSDGVPVEELQLADVALAEYRTDDLDVTQELPCIQEV
jgi:hypothetical protein